MNAQLPNSSSDAINTTGFLKTNTAFFMAELSIAQAIK
jgi:hypothetical protein